VNCSHKNKIAERLFNKFGKPVATLICCLKCGSQQKIIEMEKIEIEVTKLYKILIKRGMTQKDLHNLIKETNNGQSVSMYILNEIINGKRTNFNINTLKPIKKALNVSYDDLIDD
jgi:DNA-binding Xre family transcriptional regulator